MHAQQQQQQQVKANLVFKRIGVHLSHSPHSVTEAFPPAQHSEINASNVMPNNKPQNARQ
jgi:hypothetical protein